MKAKTGLLSLLIPWFLFGCAAPANQSSQSNAKSESSSGVTQPSSTESESTETESSHTEEEIPVASIRLNQSTLDMYEDDSSFVLTVTVLPSTATNKAVNWSSSDPSVATVYEGSITPVGIGTTVIRVTSVDGDKTAECKVTVKERIRIPDYVLHGTFHGSSTWTDIKLSVNPHSTTEYMIQGVSLSTDDVFKVHMYGDAWYGYSALKDSVDPSLVAPSSSDDNIKIRKTGIYDIYCDYNEFDGGHIYLAKTDEPTTTSSSTVRVTGISLSHSGKFLMVRNDFTITPTIYPSNATNKGVIWSSSDTSIATVTSSGRVVASVHSKVGTTTITAKTEDGNFTATCLIYVSASQYPDYCLTGTVSGRSYVGISSRYAAIPLGTGSYLIPDVELVKGDEITVTDNYGARLKNNYNQIYTKSVDRNMSVNVYLNPKDPSKDYLSFSPKSAA